MSHDKSVGSRQGKVPREPASVGLNESSLFQPELVGSCEARAFFYFVGWYDCARYKDVWTRTFFR